MLQGDRICYDEVGERDFRKQTLFALFAFSFLAMQPDAPRKRRRDASEIAPHFLALHVLLIGHGASQVEGESNENNQDGGYYGMNVDYKDQYKFCWKEMI
jgi:hypothetical protein